MDSAAGIILAGGRSRRMGRDKGLLSLPGTGAMTFVEHLVAQLIPLCGELCLVARDNVQVAAYSARQLPSMRIVTDNTPDTGPLMGLYSGLSAIQSTYALVTAVDMPAIQPAVIAFLLSLPRDDALLIPLVDAMPQVLLGIYPRSVLSLIAERLQAGRRDLRSLLQVAPVRYIDEARLREVDPHLRSFMNVNTPDELAKL